MPCVTNLSKVGESQQTISKLPLAKRLLRTREAAEYLSISTWKLRKLVRHGLLPVVQDSEGAAWRVDVRDLDTFIERNKRTEPLP